MVNEDSEPSQSQPIEILLVDDHPRVRQLLREMIESYDDLRIVGEAFNGEDAVLLAASLKPAVVIMDIHLTLIKVNNPFVTVIGVTAGDPCEDDKAMIIAGAATVINKGDASHALHPAIVSAVKQVKKPVTV